MLLGKSIVGCITPRRLLTLTSGNDPERQVCKIPGRLRRASLPSRKGA